MDAALGLQHLDQAVAQFADGHIAPRRVFGLGVGLASVFGLLTAKSELAFKLPWQLLLISAGAVAIICVFSALLSIRKVIALEPAIVFKG